MAEDRRRARPWLARRRRASEVFVA